MKGFLPGFIVLVLSLVTFQSKAATITATPAGGDWDDPATWVGGVVPTNGDDVVIPVGSTVISRGYLGAGPGGSSGIHTITITIGGTLSLEDDPQLGNHFPILSYDIQVYVQNGGVLRDNSDFNYGTVEDPDVEGAIGIGVNTVITIETGGTFVPHTDSSKIYDAGVTDPSQQHLSISETLDGPHTITNNGTEIVLPVSLYNFSGRYQSGEALLSWNTASEQNNAYFELQRSTDGRVFLPVATIQGAGTSSQPHSYSYADGGIFKLAIHGFLYYRLKQVDIDGKATYYGIVSISLKDVQATLKLWPNPNGGHFLLQLAREPKQSVIMHIYNDQGQLVSRGKFRQQQVSVDLSGKSKGIYYIQLAYPDGSKEVLNAVVQ